MIISILFALLTILLLSGGAVFYKLSVKESEPYSVTSVKTVAVIVIALIYASFTGAYVDITSVGGLNLFYLIISGVALGGAWLFYSYALKGSELATVQPIISFQPIMMMLMSMLFLYEGYSLLTIVAICLAGAGTVLMSWKKGNKRWMLFAWLSVVLSAVALFLARTGAYSVSYTLGVVVQSLVVFAMLWVTAFAKGKKNIFSGVTVKGAFFMVLAVLAMTLAAFSVQYVGTIEGVSLDKYIKLGALLLTVTGGAAMLKEKPSSVNVAGIMLVVAGVVVSIF